MSDNSADSMCPRRAVSGSVSASSSGGCTESKSFVASFPAHLKITLEQPECSSKKSARGQLIYSSTEGARQTCHIINITTDCNPARLPIVVLLNLGACHRHDTIDLNYRCLRNSAGVCVKVHLALDDPPSPHEVEAWGLQFPRSAHPLSSLGASLVLHCS